MESRFNASLLTLVTVFLVMMLLFLSNTILALGSPLTQADATAQQQTFEASVNQFFTQTAEVNQANTQTVEALFRQAMTATAEIENSQGATLTVEALFNQALTATAQNQAPVSSPVTLIIGVIGADLQVSPQGGSDILAQLQRVEVPITGRLENNRYYRVVFEGQEGWVRALNGLRVEGDLEAVPVIAAPELVISTPVPRPTRTPTPEPTPIPETALLYSEDFEDGTATGWNVEWFDDSQGFSVVDDGTGNMVWRFDGGRGEVFLSPTANYANYAVDFRFQVVDWLSEGNMSIKVRRGRNQPCGHYNMGIGRSWLYMGSSQRNCSELSELGNSSLSLSKERWHTVHIEVEGSEIRWSINGERLKRAEDRTYMTGGLGIVPWNIGEVWFDDFKIWTIGCSVKANGNVNLRGGPGTDYFQSGTFISGLHIGVDGKYDAEDGTWWKLAEGSWVRSDLVTSVGDCSRVPTVRPDF